MRLGAPRLSRAEQDATALALARGALHTYRARYGALLTSVWPLLVKTCTDFARARPTGSVTLDDLLQVAALAVRQAVKTYSGRKSFVGHLLLRVHKEIRRAVEMQAQDVRPSKHSTNVHIEVQQAADMAEVFLGTVDPSPSPEENVAGAEMASLIGDHLLSLPELERRVLVLTVTCDVPLSDAKAARELEVSALVVRRARERALAILRTSLKRHVS